VKRPTSVAFAFINHKKPSKRQAENHWNGFHPTPNDFEDSAKASLRAKLKRNTEIGSKDNF
jgi:hypothetical protein